MLSPVLCCEVDKSYRWESEEIIRDLKAEWPQLPAPLLEALRISKSQEEDMMPEPGTSRSHSRSCAAAAAAVVAAPTVAGIKWEHPPGICRPENRL